ncbi:MAG: hypothetical protein AAGA09_02370 [Pseudomonadota bacterium]
MGMSVWGLIAAPLFAPGAMTNAGADAAMASSVSASPTHYASEKTASVDDDLFAGDTLLGEKAMRETAGGSEVAFNLGDVGVNLANAEGNVSNIEANNSNSGQIASNTVANNSGITTVFNNTGTGVVMQSNVQVNVFLGDAPVTGQ